MSEHSLIQWTDATWNPVAGCTKISPGCARCYAIKEVRRMSGNPNPSVSLVYQGMVRQLGNGLLDWTSLIRTVEERLAVPLKWKKPKRIFVNSLSDLFHVDVPVEFIQKVFEVMRTAHWHQFQILTKRADRLEELSPDIDWPENVWQGVSVENRDYTFRIDHLRKTQAKTKFLSIEPLLGPISHLDLSRIDWVIVGGESGAGARELQKDWVLEIQKQCQQQKVPMFFKQWGGKNKSKSGREIDGKTYDAMPLPLKERNRVALEMVSTGGE
jgi:protein gp37